MLTFGSRFIIMLTYIESKLSFCEIILSLAGFIMEQFFSSEKFGGFLKEQREIAGYKTVRELGDAIEKLTGLRITDTTLRKLERGAGGYPSVEKIAAITAALSWKSSEGSKQRFCSKLDYLVFNSLSDSILACSEFAEIKESVKNLKYTTEAIDGATDRIISVTAYEEKIDRGEIGSILIDDTEYYKGGPHLFEHDLLMKGEILLGERLTESIEKSIEIAAEKYAQKSDEVEGIKKDYSNARTHFNNAVKGYKSAMDVYNSRCVEFSF